MTVKLKDGLKTLAVVVLLIAVWYMLSKAGVFPEIVFPSPGRVWNAFLSMLASGELIQNTLVSFGRVILGFAVSFILAFAFGVTATAFPKLDPYYRPILEFLRHIPPLALVPIMILWFGIGEASKIIVIVLTAFFPIFLNTEAGLKGCDRGLLEVGDTLGMTEFQKFFEIRLPAAVPGILVGMQLGFGYSWRAIVGAEMIAAASGLGYMILDAQALSRCDKVIVGIIVIGAVGLAIDAVFKRIIRKLSFREG